MIIGADYYESEEQRSALLAAGRIPIGIGQVGAPVQKSSVHVHCAPRSYAVQLRGQQRLGRMLTSMLSLLCWCGECQEGAGGALLMARP